MTAPAISPETFPGGLILASACLCGEKCRYDGQSAPHPLLMELHARGLVVPVCPEVLGGLSVPREPCERRGSRVVDRTGRDLTEAFARGAAMVLAIAGEKGITRAVLKERSPSCGVRVVYDGTFSSRRIPGQGITAALLRESGLAVVSEENFSL